jgi:hypothetical protein
MHIILPISRLSRFIIVSSLLSTQTHMDGYIGCSETIYPNGLPFPWETQNPTGVLPQEIDE